MSTAESVAEGNEICVEGRKGARKITKLLRANGHTVDRTISYLDESPIHYMTELVNATGPAAAEVLTSAGYTITSATKWGVICH